MGDAVEIEDADRGAQMNALWYCLNDTNRDLKLLEQRVKTLEGYLDAEWKRKSAENTP